MDHPAFVPLFIMFLPFLLLGAVTAVNATPQVLMVAAGMLIPDPNQPRKTFDKEKLEQLAASIRERGLFHPVLVRWDSERQLYIVVAGERRLRACLLLGLKEIPCRLVEGAPDELTILGDQLQENFLSECFTPIEAARGLDRYMRLLGCTQSELGQRLHISNGQVTRDLSLLLMPADLQDKIGTEKGMIPPSIAYELVRFPDEATMRQWAELVMNGKATRAQVQEELHSRIGKKNVGVKGNKLPVQLNGARATLSNCSEWTPEAVEEFAKALLKKARAAKGKGHQEFRNFMKGEGE